MFVLQLWKRRMKTLLCAIRQLQIPQVEFNESCKFQLLLKILLTHHDTSIKRLLQFKMSNHLLLNVLLLENWQQRISKIGRFQLVFPIGKMLMVIQFLCTCAFKLTEETCKTPKSILVLQLLPTLCMLQNAKLEKRQKRGTKFNTRSRWHKL